MNRTLLPAGCYDVLPPRARLETQLSYQLLNVFEAYGYQQVTPPMLEYTDSLLAGRGTMLSPQIIRVMDPHTQKVMGFRADMTLQIARIAGSRLADWLRPLRLCYAGPVLRMQADALHADRQMRQAGIELIGVEGTNSDAEIILVAMKALQAVGVGELTIDINLPILIGCILAESSLNNDEIAEVFAALSHKDTRRLRDFGEPACNVLCDMMMISGNALESLVKLQSMPLPEIAKPHLDHLAEVIAYFKPHLNDSVHLSLDVTERGGFDYYAGISFTFYATQEGRELGRGGRYLIDNAGQNESAIGCTFYTDSLRNLLPQPAETEKVYVVDGVRSMDVQKLHDQGFTTILATGKTNVDCRTEAAKQGCTYIYQQEKLIKL